MYTQAKITNKVLQQNKVRIGFMGVLPIRIERSPEKWVFNPRVIDPSSVLSTTCIFTSGVILSIKKVSFKFIKIFYTNLRVKDPITQKRDENESVKDTMVRVIDPGNPSFEPLVSALYYRTRLGILSVF